MKKIFISMIISLFIISCEQPNATQDRIIFGVAALYPPFEYKVGNELRGFDIDLANSIGKQLNKKIEFQDMQFFTLLPALQNGHVDAAIATLTITPERQEKFDFSRPYYFEQIAVVYKIEHPYQNKEELSHKKIGCSLGTTNEIWLKENVPQADIVALDNTNIAIESLKAGHLDAVVLDAPQAYIYTQKNLGLAYTILERSNKGYGIAVRKGSPLLSEINQALIVLEKNGELHKLQKKWLGIP